MLLSEIKNILGAEFLGCDETLLEKDIKTAFGSDLMSDVLAFVDEQAMLLTGLINSQVIRTAEMMDITAICFVRGKMPAEDVIELAKEKEIALLSTPKTMYTCCGLLYEKGIRGLEND